MTVDISNPQYIKIGDDSSGADTPYKYLAAGQIVSISGYFESNTKNGPGSSPYSYGKRTPGRTTKTIVTITTADHVDTSFDCDEVTNQAGWQGCTLAALQQALEDLANFLPTP